MKRPYSLGMRVPEETHFLMYNVVRSKQLSLDFHGLENLFLKRASGSTVLTLFLERSFTVEILHFSGKWSALPHATHVFLFALFDVALSTLFSGLEKLKPEVC